MELLVGALATALAFAVAALFFQHRNCKEVVDAAMRAETRALDAARAAELRSVEQINTLLDRISTKPRLEMNPIVATPPVDPKVRKYIADHPADDDAWNDFRGEPEEAE